MILWNKRQLIVLILQMTEEQRLRNPEEARRLAEERAAVLDMARAQAEKKADEERKMRLAAEEQADEERKKADEERKKADEERSKRLTLENELQQMREKFNEWSSTSAHVP
jgi:dTMP kinase